MGWLIQTSRLSKAVLGSFISGTWRESRYSSAKQKNQKKEGENREPTVVKNFERVNLPKVLMSMYIYIDIRVNIYMYMF